MSRLFGTDGIRGEAGVAPLDRSTVYCVGRALARNLAPSDGPRVLIGRDTRSSGLQLENWLACGIRAGGGEPVSAGILTTPAVAILTQRLGFSAGVVLSASHNPHPDNGIKIFSGEGAKSSPWLESAIEQEVSGSQATGIDLAESLPPPDFTLRKEYLDFLRSTLPDSLTFPPFRIGLDCAHGAAFEAGPTLLTQLELEVVAMGVSPDGENINQQCGSTHPEELANLVVETGCHLGAALDGDGDRLVLTDHTGRVVNGDAILLMCARRLRAEQRLPGSGVVATVMSNLALEKALHAEGLHLYRTQVGDKYVAEEMTRRGITLGGEQSGHIIFSDCAPTGDGLLTLLQVLRVMTLEGKPLSELAALQPFPQILLNVRVQHKPDLMTVPEITQALGHAERRMVNRGRVLVRYSGTEPLLRIMMEGPDQEEIRTLSETIASAARRTIGET